MPAFFLSHEGFLVVQSWKFWFQFSSLFQVLLYLLFVIFLIILNIHFGYLILSASMDNLEDNAVGDDIYDERWDFSSGEIKVHLL